MLGLSQVGFLEKQVPRLNLESSIEIGARGSKAKAVLTWAEGAVEL